MVVNSAKNKERRQARHIKRMEGKGDKVKILQEEFAVFSSNCGQSYMPEEKIVKRCNILLNNLKKTRKDRPIPICRMNKCPKKVNNAKV